MSSLLIASNPSGRRRHRKQSAKQRAASIRNLRKARRSRSSSSAPRRRRRRHSRAVATIKTNPRRRRRSTSRRVRRRLGIRRNPVSSLRGLLKPRALLGNTVVPALIGGGGAVANDIVWALLSSRIPASLPFAAQLQTGYLRHVGKAILAIVLGQVSGMALGRRRGELVAAGALTVVGYNVVRDLVAKFAPTVNMGLYLDQSSPSSLGWADAGWNPTYGSDWRKKSGLSMYLPGMSALPGGVSVPPQFSRMGQPFARSGGVTYQDQMDGYG